MKFWLVSKYGGGKEKACQQRIHLPLGEIWGAVTKYLFLAQELADYLFFFFLVSTATFLRRWITIPPAEGREA